MMNQREFKSSRVIGRALALPLLCLLALVSSVSAQSRIPGADKIGEKLLDVRVSEITLESINFRDQTAHMSVGLDISNAFVPVRLKDFDYSLRLYDQQAIEGHYDGTMKVGGKKASRVNLPVVVSLRSIPGVVWSAFRNRGRVQYQLDTGFTLPLFIMEKRVDQSFSGEVPLKSLVDAASLLRASRLGGGVLGGW